MKKRMKIISYNINDCQSWKIRSLLEMGADVLVVPEITCTEDAQLPDDYEMKWQGVEYFHHERKWKGLGIIWKKGLGYVPEWYNLNLMYAIPLVVGEYLIIGFWPTKHTDGRPKKPYPQIAQDIINEYAQYLKGYKTLVIGDFNCYRNQSDATKQSGDILKVNDLLKSYGFHSLYHQKTGEAFGRESTPTFYFHFDENKPFFLDYAYTNFPVASFHMLPWDREMSDHVGQVIEII